MSTQVEPNGHSKHKNPALDMASVKQTAKRAAGAVEDLVEKNPYMAVAAAFGIGYVLGGGLFSKTTARAVQMGARLMAIKQLREPVMQVAEQVLDGILENTKPSR